MTSSGNAICVVFTTAPLTKTRGVDVRRAPLIPARVDGPEGGPALGVGRLQPAEKGLSRAVVARLRVLRVVARGVALPDLDRGAEERGAGLVDVDDGEGERHGQAASSFGDVLRKKAGLLSIPV